MAVSMARTHDDALLGAIRPPANALAAPLKAG